MSTVCVVGNGPSAAARGTEIDACDFVVRCNRCDLIGPGGAGTRIDALAWYGNADGWDPPAVGEHWITLPKSRCTPPHDEHLGRWHTVYHCAAGLAAIRWITDEQWQHLAACLAMTPGPGFERRVWTPPTTGITAVCMALWCFRPRRLCLYGFDATTPDQPGYDPRPESWQHDMAGEKLMLAALRDHGRWLGGALDAPPVVLWPDAPPLDATMVDRAAGISPSSCW